MQDEHKGSMKEKKKDMIKGKKIIKRHQGQGIARSRMILAMTMPLRSGFFFFFFFFFSGAVLYFHK